MENAAERAYRLGCNTFQIFSSSPRQWKPFELARSQCEAMSRLREKYDLRPLVIHANYLINVAGANAEFQRKSIAAFRAEIERGIALVRRVPGAAPGIVPWFGAGRRFEAGRQRHRSKLPRGFTWRVLG